MYRCPLISPRKWFPPGEQPRPHMGGPSLVGEDPKEPDLRDGYVNLEEPHDSNQEGCPGSYYRCEWVWSCFRYMRPVSFDGVYSANQELDRTTNRLTIDAIRHLEYEQSRWRAWYRRTEAEQNTPME